MHEIAHRNAGFGYQPALDGVRAIAVAMVLAFHAGYEWMSGGYVGVSVFFTLSGYLITSLALAEHEHTGRLDVGAFYSRRIRRLLPASVLCLVAVMLAARAGQFHGVTNLRRDLLAALTQVYNWVALAGQDTYAQQVARAAGQRAPLDHYWSLAIEEQFYWLWPVAMLAVLRWSTRGRVVVVGVLTAAFGVVAVTIAVVAGPGAAYFATPARLPEILLGALVAVGWRAWPLREGGHKGRRARQAPALALCVLALAAIGAAAVVWPASGGPATTGWLPAFAVASAGLVVGLQTASPVRRMLSTAPLVALGRISYGVYLFHWPVYTIVDERRIDLGRTALFAIRVVITLAVATASYLIVELPVRRGQLAWRSVGPSALAVCLALAAAVALVPDQPGDYTYVADATRFAAAIAPAPPLIPLPPLVQRPARVLVIGDSTAYATGEGMIEWAFEHPDVVRVSSLAAVGCGLNGTGDLPDDGYREVCDRIREDTPAKVRRLRPDVVVAMVTMRDMEDRRWSPAEGVLTPTDARFRRHLLDGYRIATQQLLDAGAEHVVWVIPPTPHLPAIGELAPMLDPARIDAYRRVLRALPLSLGARVIVVDLATWIDGLDDPPDRPDGLHFSLDGAVDVADQFLMPAALAAAGVTR